MEPIYQKPMDIEARSMAIIEEHLTGVTLPEPERSILKRVIHTTADFDYTENLCFSENAVSSALEALQRGAHIVTDTNMALSGINKRSLHGLGCEAYCFMSDADVAEEARMRGVTRAMVSMEKACLLDGDLIFAVGNAPTALIQLDELIRAGKLLPKLIIGVPVGFVNVVEAKELIMHRSGCRILWQRGERAAAMWRRRSVMRCCISCTGKNRIGTGEIFSTNTKYNI